MTDTRPARIQYRGGAETFDDAYNALKDAVETARIRHPYLEIEAATVHRRHAMPADGLLHPKFGWQVDLNTPTEESSEPF